MKSVIKKTMRFVAGAAFAAVFFVGLDNSSHLGELFVSNFVSAPSSSPGVIAPPSGNKDFSFFALGHNNQVDALDSGIAFSSVASVSDLLRADSAYNDRFNAAKSELSKLDQEKIVLESKLNGVASDDEADIQSKLDAVNAKHSAALDAYKKVVDANPDKGEALKNIDKSVFDKNSDCKDSDKCVRLTVAIPDPMGGSSLSSLDSTTAFETYIEALYKYLIFIGGIGGTFMIVLGGFQVMISGENQELASSGVDKVKSAIFGMIFLLAISFILNAVNPHFFSLGG
jgi:hypothetical protein